MKPIVPVWLLVAAAAPTRNEPCSSANTSDAMFGASTTESMMREAGVGVVGGGFGHRVTEEEADADDESVALVDEALDALGAVAVARGGGLAGDDAELLDSLVEAGTGGVVERTVATAGDVVDDADFAVALGRGAIGTQARCPRCFGPAGASVSGASLDELASSSLPHTARPWEQVWATWVTYSFDCG